MRKEEFRERLAPIFAEAGRVYGNKRLCGRSPPEGGEPNIAVLDDATGEIEVWDLSRCHGGARRVEWAPEDINWQPSEQSTG